MEDSGETPGKRVGDSTEGGSPGVGNRDEESEVIEDSDNIYYYETYR